MVAEMQEKGGFSFDLCRRNEALGNAGIARPGFRKTGTTIVGAVYKVPTGTARRRFHLVHYKSI